MRGPKTAAYWGVAKQSFQSPLDPSKRATVLDFYFFDLSFILHTGLWPERGWPKILAGNEPTPDFWHEAMDDSSSALLPTFAPPETSAANAHRHQVLQVNGMPHAHGGAVLLT